MVTILEIQLFLKIEKVINTRIEEGHRGNGVTLHIFVKLSVPLPIIFCLSVLKKGQWFSYNCQHPSLFFPPIRALNVKNYKIKIQDPIKLCRWKVHILLLSLSCLIHIFTPVYKDLIKNKHLLLNLENKKSQLKNWTSLCLKQNVTVD